MKKYFLKERFLPFLASLFLLIFLGCGSGGGGGSDSSGDNGGSSLNLAGTWNGNWVSSRGANSGTLATSLTQNGTSISGTVTITDSPCMSSATVSGSISGSNLTLQALSGSNSLNFSATATSTSISGTYSVPSGECAGDTGYISLAFDDNSSPVTPTVNVTGYWSGTYSSNLVSPSSITLELTQSGSNISGTDSSTNGANGTVSGTVSDDTISFMLYQETTGCFGAFSGTGTVSGDTMTLSFTGADCLGIHSSGSGTVTRLSPAAPTGLTATPGDDTITLSWNEVPSATSYNIYWSNSPGVSKTSYTYKLTDTAPPYIHTDRMNGMSYYYVITAVNGYGESMESNEASATPVSVSGELVLASGTMGYPYGIAVDSTSVYWAEFGGGNNGNIKKVGINGGTVTTLATGLDSPKGIAVDSTSVYWTEYSGGTVKKVGINGGTVTTLASSLLYLEDVIAVDLTNVYYTVDSNVMKVGKNNDTPTTIALGESSSLRIAVDSTSVYWTEYVGSSGTIKKVGISGGTVTTLATGLDYPYGIAVDSTSVYWTEYDGSGAIKKVGINGGAVTNLAFGLYPKDIVVDSANVYWTEYYEGAIKKVGINGGAVTTIVSDVSYPEGITIDAANVYWTEYYNRVVKKVPKN